MNGEKLLRAMSYVDEDLVERAEKAPRRKSHWVRWAAMAACLCLVLGSWMMTRKAFSAVFSDTNRASASQDIGGEGDAKTESVREAPQADESGEETMPQAEEPGIGSAGANDTEPAMMTGDADTGDWFIRMDSDSAINASADMPDPTVVRSRQELEGYAIPPEVMEQYGEDFFLTRDLLLVAVGGGTEHPRVIRLENTADGWALTLSGIVEGEDAVMWRLLLPIDKNQIMDSEIITIKEEGTK